MPSYARAGLVRKFLSLKEWDESLHSRDDHGRFGTGSHHSDATQKKDLFYAPPGQTELPHTDTVDKAWKALNPDRFDQEKQMLVHPENYEPNGGYGYHLKIGATEWVKKEVAGGFPMVQQVIGTDTSTLSHAERLKYAMESHGTTDGKDVCSLPVPGSERPAPFTYRVMHVNEFEEAKTRGYFKSNESMNLAAEGTVTGTHSTGSFYLPMEHVPGFKPDTTAARATWQAAAQESADTWKPYDEHRNLHGPTDQLTDPTLIAERQAIMDRSRVASDRADAAANALRDLEKTARPAAYVHKGDARIVQLRLEPEDGWKVDGADGYVKTHSKIPFERVANYSEPIHQEEG